MPKKIIYADDAIDAVTSSVMEWDEIYVQDLNVRISEAIQQLPSAQPKIIRCEDCMHNGSFDTDCPIDWNGKEYCSFAERIDDE